jgi:uncharacterized membrane protein
LPEHPTQNFLDCILDCHSEMVNAQKMAAIQLTKRRQDMTTSEVERDTGVNFGNLVAGIGIGAAAMYVLDPDRGRRRRALAADTLALAWHQVRDSADVTARDLANRTRGIANEIGAGLGSEEAEDRVLEERVRSKLGRLVSHPSAIEVRAENGTVTLTGPVLESEVSDLISGVESIRGVRSVENRLEPHKQASDIPSLQGGTGRRAASRLDIFQENWAPSTRFLVGIAGGLMVLGAIGKRNVLSNATGIIGGALLVRSISNMRMRQLLGATGRRAIDIQKTIHVAAPVEEVYRLWRNQQNFPRFMSHVKNVEPAGEGRYRWTVSGPGGLPVSWNAIVTREIPNRLLAWKSEPGSIVGSAGIVRFDRDAYGTRVHIRMSYNPPGGAIGHAVAALFGADPKHAMDEDLVRLKSLLEVGKTRVEGAQVRREEIAG